MLYYNKIISNVTFGHLFYRAHRRVEKYHDSLTSDLAQIWRWSAFREIKISKCESANFLSQNFENFQDV